MIAITKFLAMCALSFLALAVPEDELTFAQIAAYNMGGPGEQNTTGQFSIVLSRSVQGETPVVNQPLVCSSAVYDECYNFSNPLPTQPFRVLETEIMTMTATYKWGNASLKTYLDQTPSTFQGKVCYSMVASENRKWRKKNKAYPAYTQNCPFDFPKIPFPADLSQPIVTTFNLAEEDMMPTATFFVMIWIECAESEEVCAFDTTENKNYIQTEIYETTTTEMTIVATVMSIASVTIFLGFFSFDAVHFKRTGRGFYF